MTEVARTNTYIVCQTKHLSTFAVSADDVVPQFNLVNPVDAAELFSNINLANALAIFIVGFLFLGFGIAIFVGWQVDKRERARFAIESKIAAIDARMVGDVKKLDAKSQQLLKMLPAAMGGSKPSSSDPKAKAAEEDEVLNDKSLTLLEKIGIMITREHELSRIVFLQPTEHFTRPQRLTVMMSLILGQIAVVAIFFGLNPSNIAAKLIIGVVSAVVLFPAKTLFRTFFDSSTYIAPPKKRRRGFLGKRGKHEAGPEPISNRRTFTYRVTVVTGNLPGGGTSSDVALVLYGDRGDSGVCLLPAGPGIFSQGQSDVFELPLPDIGRLQKIHIGLESGKKEQSNWYLATVEVVNTATGEGGHFACNSWLEKKRITDRPMKILEITSAFRAENVHEPQLSSLGRRSSAATAATEATGPSQPALPPAPSFRPTRRWRSVVNGVDYKTAPGIDGYMALLPPPGAPVAAHEEGSGFVTPAEAARMSNPPPAPVADAARPRRRIPLSTAGSMNEGAMLFSGAPPAPPAPTPGTPGMMRPKRTHLRATALAIMAATQLQEEQQGQQQPELQAEASGASQGGRPRRLVPLGPLPGNPDMTLKHLPRQDKLDRQARVKGLLREGGLEAGVVVFVPPALENVIVKVQRAWRRRRLVLEKQKYNAVLKMQAHWRGWKARKLYREEKEAIAQGKNISGPVWWVAAHQPKEAPAALAVPGHFQGPFNSLTRLSTAANAVAALKSAGTARASAHASRSQVAAGPTSKALGRQTSMLAASFADRMHRASLSVAPPARMSSWISDADKVARKRQKTEMERKAEEALKEQIEAAKEREKRQRERRKALRERRRRKGLPRWFIWFTYAFCLMFNAVAGECRGERTLQAFPGRLSVQLTPSPPIVHLCSILHHPVRPSVPARHRPGMAAVVRLCHLHGDVCPGARHEDLDLVRSACDPR